MLKHVAALAATGVFAVVPFASAAYAAQPAPGVNFTGGGLGLLLCGSKPETPRITVGAETKVRLTNSLGMGAELRIDGSPSATVASGETVEVQFHSGPVGITMIPDCALNLNPKFEPLTVDVTAPPPPAAVPPVKPAPVQPKPSVKPAQPTPTQPSTGSNPGAQPSPEAALPALPEDPLFPGAITDVPQDGATPTKAAVVNPDGSTAQKKNLAGQNGPVDNGPIGLLAIIATVCVVGVSAGAIRAIITQKAMRTEFA
jgi:hypothetical protein